MEMAGENIRTTVMDHHGLVAAVCRDLKIAERINQRLDRRDPRRIVSAGTAAVAMILNGLGFTNRRLYLTPQFFESKPVEALLGDGILAEHLDDHTLGKALDEIARYGSSQLFGELAFEIAIENNLLSSLAHLDSTSMSVEGQYEVGDDASVVKLTYGHSKDHRPDLKQVIMSLVVSGKSAMPIWMEPLDGNASDKATFHETIKKVREFQKQLQGCPTFKWVADSALYHKDKLLKQADYLWLSRVPETIKEARALVEKSDSEISWTEREKGYKTANFTSHYGNIEQRWLLIYSEKSYQREKKTVERKLKKSDEVLEKKCWHLRNDVFLSESDALNALQEISKKFSLYLFEYSIESVVKHTQAGRPKKNEMGDLIGYKLNAKAVRNQTAIELLLNRKGRFILATNDLDTINFSDEQILSEYKSQQDVEQGFRFIKDPWFMVDSIFLKSPKRIEALMMIMTLCLMVYNIGEYRLRTALVENNETLPNQINKPIQNPTLRWIFQIMEGISVICFYKKNLQKSIKEMIANLNELRLKIIRLFGPTAQQIYGIG